MNLVFPYKAYAKSWTETSTTKFIWEIQRIWFINAFKVWFPNADHLLYTIHAIDNIRRKSDQLWIDSKSFKQDTFEVKLDEIKVAELGNCFSEEEFDAEYERLCNI